MSKIIILGSSAEFPFPRTVPNKFENYLDIENYEKNFPTQDDPICNLAKRGGRDRRTRACAAIVTDRGAILLDAGPDIKYQLAKYHLNPAVVFLTHEHPDANYGLKYLPDVEVFSEKTGLAPGKKIETCGARITAFRVAHSHLVPSLGFKIELDHQTIVYLGDTASLRGIKRWLNGADIIFADGSILKRNLPGHMPIVKQLRWFKEWKIKRVIFTHIGHETLPHEELDKFVKILYPKAEIAFDGMDINL